MSMLRLPYWDLSPEILKHYIALNAELEKSPLGKPFIELINLRISQINGCAFCLDMHSKALRKGGETTPRLDALAGWRVSELFTPRERAALAWAEAMTHISNTRDIADEIYLPLKELFSDKEISDLTFAAATMNALNRLAISMRK